MRQIISKDSQERKDRMNKVFLGVLLVIIMLLSTLGYAFFSSDNSNNDKIIEYKGIKFRPTDYGKYSFIFNGVGYETEFTPLDTLNISTSITKTIQNYYNQPLYFAYDNPDDISGLSINEIVLNIGNIITRWDEACLYENCTGDYSVKSCSENNIIIFKAGNETKIREDLNCVYIYWNEEEQLKGADAFLFKIIGIDN